MPEEATPVRCSICRQPKSVAEMVPTKKSKLGYYPYCRPCDNRQRRERYAQRRGLPRMPRECHRKLPPWKTLRKLYVEDGLSYADIAEKYNVNRSTVYLTIRRRAQNRGEWPLKPWLSRNQKMRQTLAGGSIKPTLIILLVWDHLDQHAAWYRWADHVELEATGRLPRRRAPFTRALQRFCEKHGFTPSYLRDIRGARHPTISRGYARRLLEAIGEDVPDDLSHALRSRKYSGNYRRRRSTCERTAPAVAALPSASTASVHGAGSPLSEAS